MTSEGMCILMQSVDMYDVKHSFLFDISDGMLSKEQLDDVSYFLKLIPEYSVLLMILYPCLSLICFTFTLSTL